MKLADFVKSYRRHLNFSSTDNLTPVSLARKMVMRVVDSVDEDDLTDATFLDPSCGTGIFLAVLFDELFDRLQSQILDDSERARHIYEKQLFGVDVSPVKIKLSKRFLDPRDNFNLNLLQQDSLQDDLNMTFDAVVGNPPFQKDTGSSGRQKSLWPLFVEKAFNVTKGGGYVSLIHPGGWRQPKGAFKETQNTITSKDVKYLEVYDKDDNDIFDEGTDWGWYLIKNENVDKTSTTVVSKAGTTEKVDLTSMQFVPSVMDESLLNLIADNPKDRVNMIRDSSYHTQRDWVAKERSGEFCNPLVYSVLKDGTINFRWSSLANRGHFGVPKVIWSNGTSHPVVDEKGAYGLTEFSYAIADEPEVLPKIKEAMLSREFLEIMGYLKNYSHRYNRDLIELLRKNFWRGFI